MPRPKYLDCVMTPEIISRIRSNQECYDADPVKWERREAEVAEQRQRDEEDEREQYQEALEEAER